MRFFFTTLCALILGAVYWDIGSKRDSTIYLFSVMGALQSVCLSLGVNNSASVQPVISIERTVFYREKAAGMYSQFAYAAAQVLVEIPYIAAQTLIYGFITYFMIGFERTEMFTLSSIHVPYIHLLHLLWDDVCWRHIFSTYSIHQIFILFTVESPVRLPHTQEIHPKLVDLVLLHLPCRMDNSQTSYITAW